MLTLLAVWLSVGTTDGAVSPLLSNVMSVEARHNDVVATIERLFGKGLLRSSRKTRREETGGRPVEVYDLIERDTHLVVSRYSDEHRARVIDRWQELEAQQAPVHAIPQTLAQALRLAAEQAEAIEQITLERDEAKRTKALIGSKREAAAMGRASAALREVNRLTGELGRNMRHATVIAVEKALGRKFGKQDWRPLRQFCQANGLSAEKVTDPRYGEVKAWPAEAWQSVHGVDLATLFAPKDMH